MPIRTSQSKAREERRSRARRSPDAPPTDARSERSITAPTLIAEGALHYHGPILRHIQNAARSYNDQAYRQKYVHEQFTPEQIAQALRRITGGIRAAARRLRSTPATIHRYLELYPHLKAVAAAEVQVVLDLCQEGLLHDAVNGDAAARRFVLLTRGRHRGYVIRRETTGRNGQSLTSAQPKNTLVIVDAHKKACLDKLRAARAAQGAPRDVMAFASSAVGNAHNGDVPA